MYPKARNKFNEYFMGRRSFKKKKSIQYIKHHGHMTTYQSKITKGYRIGVIVVTVKLLSPALIPSNSDSNIIWITNLASSTAAKTPNIDVQFLQ